MTANEIRRQSLSTANLKGLNAGEKMMFFMLGEVAAQLAEMNEHLEKMESGDRHCYVENVHRG